MLARFVRTCTREAVNDETERAVSKEEAQAVEDLLAGGPLCPWCSGQCSWENGERAFCTPCGRFFFRSNRGMSPAYRVGSYWTVNWSWAYEVTRPKDSKDETSWMDGVNTKRPKRKLHSVQSKRRSSKRR